MNRRYRFAFDEAGGLRATLEAEWSARTSYRFVLHRPEMPGPIVVAESDIAPPRGTQFEIRAEGLWAAIHCETAGEHWSFGLEAFGLAYDDEASAAAGGYGDRVPVGIDLEWEADTPGAAAGIVHGDVLLGAERLGVDARGTFSVDELQRS